MMRAARNVGQEKIHAIIAKMKPLKQPGVYSLYKPVRRVKEGHMLKRKTFSMAFIVFALAITAAPSYNAQEAANSRQQTDYVITLPEGTILPIILTAYLNTRNSQIGDTVYASTTYPIWIQQRLVIPKGSEIRGTLTDVVRPGRIKGKGRLAIRFDDILLPNGIRRNLTASFRGIHGPGDENIDRSSETVTNEGSKGDDTGTVVSTTSQGAIIGLIAGGGKGAAIGTGIGGAAGIATVLFTRGKDLVLEPGTQFDLELVTPLEFSYYELEFTNSQLNSAEDSVRSNTQRRPSSIPDSGGRQSLPIPRIGFPSPF
jgi:hypothetical protein